MHEVGTNTFMYITAMHTRLEATFRAGMSWEKAHQNASAL